MGGCQLPHLPALPLFCPRSFQVWMAPAHWHQCTHGGLFCTCANLSTPPSTQCHATIQLTNQSQTQLRQLQHPTSNLLDPRPGEEDRRFSLVSQSRNIIGSTTKTKIDRKVCWCGSMALRVLQFCIICGQAGFTVGEFCYSTSIERINKQC